MLFVMAAMAVMLSLMGSCGGTGKKAAGAEKPSFDSVVVDTVVGLRGADDSLKCAIRMRLLYAKGANAQLVNDSVFASALFSADIWEPGDKRIDGSTLRQTADKFTAAYIENCRKEIGEMVKEGFDEPSFGYEYVVETSVSEGRNGGIAYVIDAYEYTGGAHGMYYEMAMNFDLAAGKLLSKGDVFAEGSDSLIGGEIAKSLVRQRGVKDLEALIDSFGYADFRGNVPDNFILGKDSVTFIYQPYEIAPYCEGLPRAVVAYSDIKGCLRK